MHSYQPMCRECFLHPLLTRFTEVRGWTRGKGESTPKRPSFSPATELRLSLLGKVGQEYVKNCQEGKSSCMPCLSRSSTDGHVESWRVEDGYVNMKTHSGTETSASCPRDFS